MAGRTWLLSYTYMCHQHDLSALGANVGLLRRFIRSSQNVKVSKKSVVKCCPREGERAASKGTEQKAAPFFLPRPTLGHRVRQQKKHCKENDKKFQRNLCLKNVLAFDKTCLLCIIVTPTGGDTQLV